MKNVIKIVLLGIVGFALLVYLTIPNIDDNQQTNKEVSFEMLPKYFDVVGKNPYTKKDDIFKDFSQTFLVVLNHDSLAVFKELYKKTDKNIVLVANISNTPWLIKQIAVNGELEKMYKNSKIPLINDSDGAFIRALNIIDNSQNKYYVYKILDNGMIESFFSDSVKKGALQDGISSEEIDNSLDKFLNKLK